MLTAVCAVSARNQYYARESTCMSIWCYATLLMLIQRIVGRYRALRPVATHRPPLLQLIAETQQALRMAGQAVIA